MAVLVAISPGGSIQSSTVWATTDTTSLQNGANNNSSTASTTFINSSAFTPGAITVDGIGLKFNGPTDATGNFIVQLANAGVAVSGTTVTIAKTDLTTLSAGKTGYNWVFFKFSSPVTLIASTAYTIQCKVSAGASLTIQCTTTGGNFIRFLRTTTTQAPTSTDSLIIANERTGSGTFNTVSVTMDNLSTSTFCGEINITDGGVLTFGTAVSNQYVLQLAGNLNVWLNGTLTIGSIGGVMPSSSSANIIFVCASNNQFGMNCYDGSTVQMYGSSKTSNCLTTAAVASAQAVVACSDVTGWVVGDQIVLSSTSSTASQSDSRTIGTISGLNVTANSNFTNAHRFSVGPPNYYCEVINLTRNVVIKPNSTFGTYWINKQSTSLALQNVELATFSTNGINLDTTSTQGSTSITHCSFHEWTGAVNIGNNSYTNNGNVTFQNNVLYNFSGNTINVFHNTTLSTVVIQNNVLILGGGYGLNITGVGATFFSNYISGMTNGGFGIANTGTFGTFDANFVHSCTGPGWIVYNNFSIPNGKITNFTAWCCSHGMRIANSVANNGYVLTVDGGNLYGNTSAGFAIDVAIDGNILVRGMNIDGGTSPTQQAGFQYGANCFGMSIDSIVFGQYNVHSAGDLRLTAATIGSLGGANITMNSTPQLANPTNLTNPGQITFNRFNGNGYKTWTSWGIISQDLSIYNTGPQSMRITPSSSTFKVSGGLFQVAIGNGQSMAVSVNIRRSISGDGAAYNGNAPRLVVKKNVPMGIAADTVIDTSTGSAGTWELLTGTCPTPTDNGVVIIQIDCDGTTGWINVDDFQANITPSDTTTFSIWSVGQPLVMYGASPPEVIVAKRNTKVM